MLAASGATAEERSTSSAVQACATTPGWGCATGLHLSPHAVPPLWAPLLPASRVTAVQVLLVLRWCRSLCQQSRRARGLLPPQLPRSLLLMLLLVCLLSPALHLLLFQ